MRAIRTQTKSAEPVTQKPSATTAADPPTENVAGGSGQPAPNTNGLIASNAPSIDAPPKELEQAIGTDVPMRDPAAPNTLQKTDGPIAAGGVLVSLNDDASVLISRVQEHDDSIAASLGLKGLKLSGNSAAYIATDRVTVFVMFAGATPDQDVPTITPADLEASHAPQQQPPDQPPPADPAVAQDGMVGKEATS